jgi:hypothetical protein
MEKRKEKGGKGGGRAADSRKLITVGDTNEM